MAERGSESGGGPRHPAARERGVKLALLAFATVGAGLLLLEGACSVAWLLLDLRVFHRSRPVVSTRLLEERHAEHDPELGWRHVPGRRIAGLYGPGADLTITADGFRGLEPVLDRAAGGRYRVVCVGDSFTLGYGVGDRETYPQLLQSLNPRVQAVNLGQGGYSVGQGYLWYRSLAERLRGDAVVFAFIIDDMLRLEGARNESGYGRPVFRLAGGAVSVSNQPVPPPIAYGARLLEAGETVRFVARHSALARSIAAAAARPEAPAPPEEAELLPLMLAMFAQLDRESRARSRTFAAVLLPTSRDVPGREDYSRVNDQYCAAVSAAVRQFSEERGIRYLDLRPAFAALPREVARSLFLDEPYHHYSALGNEFVARQLDAWLREVAPGYPGAR